MKIYHYLLLFVLAFCWNNVKAQVTDFSQFKKGVTTSASAKKNVTSVSTIENNVCNNLVIIQQNYQLEDITADEKKLFGLLKKKSLFGLGGNKHFGTVYTIGVKSENGYYTDGRAVLPWLYDPNYNKYRNRNQYEPLISETNYRLWGDREYREFKFNEDPNKLSKDSILLIKKKMSKPMLPIDSKTGDQKGWIVWVIRDNKHTEPDVFVLSAQSADLKFDASTGAAVFNGNVPQQVVSGLFVTEQENKRGQIITVLSGLALKDNGKWLVKKPAVVTPDNNTKQVNNVNPNELSPTK
ncbi:MAG: hypothetical protein LBR97_02395 [Dysgonamonadaceae bacterium]|jgi:hypothetical protein|nr:hypothetical protein [Dysgonamonadaceae bacterium]